MRWSFAKIVVEEIAEIGDIINETLVSFGRELTELGEDPVRTRQGIVAACSVMLATFLALLFEVEIAVVGGHQRVYVADVDRRGLAARRG